MSHHNGVDNTVFFIAKLILLELANTLVGILGNIARRGFQVAAQNLHKGRFATTVSADKTVTIAFAKFNRNVFE